MCRARTRFDEDHLCEAWDQLKLEVRNIMVAWLVQSSQRAFLQSAPMLFRSYHARCLFGEQSDVMRAGFEQAHFVRRCELVEQLQRSLEHPNLSVRGCWYHLRSALPLGEEGEQTLRT